MGDDWWKLVPAFIQAFAAFGALIFLLIRYYRGSEITNLSLTVESERVKSGLAELDWLVVRLTLKKGDRNTVVLHDIQARFSTVEKPVVFTGNQRLGHELCQGRYRIAWDTANADYPLINLPAGDETQLAAWVQVPSDKPCIIEVVVVGIHYGQKVGPGQWQASDVSLPLSPNCAAANL